MGLPQQRCRVRVGEPIRWGREKGVIRKVEWKLGQWYVAMSVPRGSVWGPLKHFNLTKEQRER